jgi:TonB family protein
MRDRADRAHRYDFDCGAQVTSKAAWGTLAIAVLLAACVSEARVKSPQEAEAEIRAHVSGISSHGQALRPISVPAPVYPRDLAKARVEGEVEVTFLVNRRGDVIQPHVVRSSNPEFSRSVSEALVQWRFEPIVVNGQPQETRFKLVIPFRFAKS